MRALGLILAATLAMVAGGCATGTTPSSAGSPGASAQGLIAPASPTASPTAPPPAVLTVEAAAAAYLVAATAYNKALAAADKKYPSSGSVSVQKKYWKAIAKAEDAFIEQVKKIAFPPDIQPLADKLISADVVAQRDALYASKAPSKASFPGREADALKSDKKAADAAALLRDALGLPPNA